MAWIILGLIAGFIGSKIVNRHGEGHGEGMVLDMVMGIVGAIVGGWIMEPSISGVCLSPSSVPSSYWPLRMPYDRPREPSVKVQLAGLSSRSCFEWRVRVPHG